MLKTFKIFILVLLLCTMSALIYCLYIIRDLPDCNKLWNYELPKITRIYTSDFYLIEEYGQEKRVFQPLADIPTNVINAFIASEDKNFFFHKGFDTYGLIRTGFQILLKPLFPKRKIGGGSTISQQLIKNLLLNNKRSIERKIKEIALSYVITKKFSKDQILELYLNYIYFGSGIYGISEAANFYFNKNLQSLDIDEIAFLAGVLPAPGKYTLEKNYHLAKMRRNYVINRMLEDEYISLEEAKYASSKPLLIQKHEKHSKNGVRAPHVADKIRSIVISKFGERYFYTQGLTIISTISSKCQNEANLSLSNALSDYNKARNVNIEFPNWQKSLKQIAKNINIGTYNLGVVLNIKENAYDIGFSDGTIYPLMSKVYVPLAIGDLIMVDKIGKDYIFHKKYGIDGAIFAMNHTTGQVLAMSGGVLGDKFDRATQAKRQIGSLVKTFVYLAALENNIEPNEVFIDENIAIEVGKNQILWEPRNYEKNFLGPLTFRRAFELSRNIVTIKIGMQIGLDKVFSVINKCGINLPASSMHLSTLLGALESTLQNQVSAYAIIANGGKKVEPQFIEYIQNSAGEFIYKRMPIMNSEDMQLASKNAEQVINPASAFQMVSLMNGAATRGTARGFQKGINTPLAGKTGTSNDNSDAWFIGFNTNIIVGSYVGFDHPHSLGDKATGGLIALPIVKAFFTKAIIDPDGPIVHFPICKNIYFKKINLTTGKETNEENGIMESFKMNTLNSIN
jgi:penicillin-binding protein 1A